MFKQIKLTSIGFAILALSFGNVVIAQNNNKPKESIQTNNINKFEKREKALIEKIKKLNPKFDITKATYLEDVKLFELKITGVETPTYTNEEFTFFFNNGDLLNPHTRVNITQLRSNIKEPSTIISEKNKTTLPPINKASDLFTTLPFDTAIKMTYGKTGQRAIAIFSDPQCPFCKRMDSDIMRNLKGVDIDIYYFMNPLNIPGHEKAPEIASKVLCSDNKVQAWKEWMLLGKEPSNDGKACVSIVKQHTDIAIHRNYNETPTIITDTGFELKSTLDSRRFQEFLADTKDYGKK